jgi:hypothetical protein
VNTHPRSEATDLAEDLTHNLLGQLQQDGVTGADITHDTLTDALRMVVAGKAQSPPDLDPELEHVWSIAIRTRGRAERDLAAIRSLRSTFRDEANAEARAVQRDRTASSDQVDTAGKLARLLAAAARRADRFTLPDPDDTSRYASADADADDEAKVRAFVDSITGQVTGTLAAGGVDVTQAKVTRALYAALTSPVGQPAAEPYDAEIEHILALNDADPVQAAERTADLYELRKGLMEQADAERVLHINVLLHRGVRPATILRILPGLERQHYDRMQNRTPADVASGDFTNAFRDASVVMDRDLGGWREDAKAAQVRFRALDEAYETVVRARQWLVWSRYNNPTHQVDTDLPNGRPSYRTLAEQFRMSPTTADFTRKKPEPPEIYQTAN